MLTLRTLVNWSRRVTDARLTNAHRDEESVENRLGTWGTPRNVDVHRHDTIDPADRGIGSFAEDSAAAATGTDGDHDARLRHRFVGPTQRDLHVAGHGPGHEQQVGVTGAGNQMNAVPLQIVERVGGGGDLHLAAVATPGIDLTDVERTAEAAANALAQAFGRFSKRRARLIPGALEGRAAGRRIDGERRSPRKLLSAVGRYFDVVRDTDRPLRTVFDTGPALNA